MLPAIDATATAWRPPAEAMQVSISLTVLQGCSACVVSDRRRAWRRRSIGRKRREMLVLQPAHSPTAEGCHARDTRNPLPHFESGLRGRFRRPYRQLENGFVA